MTVRDALMCLLVLLGFVIFGVGIELAHRADDAAEQRYIQACQARGGQAVTFADGRQPACTEPTR